MSKLVESLKLIDEQGQIELLQDYLVDAREDGQWHEAYAIETRLGELKSTNKEAADAVEREREKARRKDDGRRETQYENSFVARGLD